MKKKYTAAGFTFIEVALAGIVILVGMVAVSNIFRKPLEVTKELDSSYREKIVADQILKNGAEKIRESSSATTGYPSSFAWNPDAPYTDNYSVFVRADSDPRQSTNNNTYLQDITLLVGNPSGAGGSGGGSAGRFTEEVVVGGCPDDYFSHYLANNDVTDDEGNNNGTIPGAPRNPGFNFGLISQALQLDGVDDYVNLGNFNPPAAGTGLTIAGWIRAESWGGGDVQFISKASGAADANTTWSLGVTQVGNQHRLKFNLRAGGITSTLTAARGDMFINIWTFVAATYDATTGQMTLYRGNNAVGNMVHAAGGAVSNTADPVWLGSQPDGGVPDRAFNGLMEEFQLFDYPLGAPDMAATFSCTCGGNPRPAGQLSWWKADKSMNDAQGDNDGVNLADDATYTSSTGGQMGFAFTMDGGNDWVEVNDDATLDITGGDIGISAWVQITDPNENDEHTILGKKQNTGDADGYAMTYHPQNNRVRLYGSGADFCEATGVNLDTAWHHIVGTYDSGTATCAIYVDNVDVTTDATMTGVTVANAEDLRIGGRPSTNNGEWRGQLDEIELYDQPLTAADVNILYTVTGGGLPPPPTPPAPAGTISLWQGENNANDSVGPNNGAVENGAGYVAGQVGASAFDFDGNNDGMRVNPVAAGFPSTAITASYWINSNNSGEAMISYASGGSTNDFLVFRQDDIRVFIDGTERDTNVDVNDGNWHHVIITWTNAGGNINVYVDGVNQYSGTGLRNGGSITAGGCFYLAREQDAICGGFSASQNLGGQMDQVRLYGRELTAAEALQLYQADGGVGTANIPCQSNACGSAKVDVAYILDVSGSMSGEINNVKNNLAGMAQSMICQGLEPYFAVYTVAAGGWAHTYQDAYDNTRREIDASKDVPTVVATINGINVSSAYVDMYAPLLEVTPEFDDNQNPYTNAYAINPAPGFQEPDAITRSTMDDGSLATLSEILVTDTTPETQLGRLSSRTTAPDPLYVANGPYGNNSAQREQDHGTLLAGLGYVTVYAITKPGMYNRYDDIIGATGGSFDIDSPKFGDELASIADAIVNTVNITTVQFTLTSFGSYVTGDAGRITINRVTSPAQKAGF